ncbi:MAG: DUF2318 domain-containing protein [Candidatus Micrarchaeota archaeon]
MNGIVLFGLGLLLLFGCTQGTDYGKADGIQQNTGANDGRNLGTGTEETGEGTSGLALDGDKIVIPISEVSEKTKVYSFDSGFREVRFFAVMGMDGNPHVAFDACDVCGGRKGYRQDGNDMVCNNCGRHFKIEDIGSANLGGGCWPSYLPYEVDGQNIVINKADLAKGAVMFR